MRLGVLRQREFRLVFLAQGISVLSDWMVAVALVFAVLGLGGTPSEGGLVLAVLGIGALLGGVVAVRARPARPLVVVAAVGLAFSVPLACLAAGAPAAVLAAGALPTGMATMVGNSVWESTLQRHIPADQLSRVSAYDWFGSMAFAPLGLILGGRSRRPPGSPRRCGSPPRCRPPPPSGCWRSRRSGGCLQCRLQ